MRPHGPGSPAPPCDIKTGEAPDATRYKLSVYAARLPHPRALLRRAVELREDGGYRVIAFETSDYHRDLNTFLRAFDLFKTREESRTPELPSKEWNSWHRRSSAAESA